MRFAALFLLAFAYSGAFSRDPGQPAPTEPPPPPVAAQIRQANDSDFVVQEWQSPIAFDLDAGWLRTLPPGEKARIKDLPTFFCDGITLDRMDVRRGAQTESGTVRVGIEFHMQAHRDAGEKVVVLELTLVHGEQRLLLAHRDDLKLSAGDSESWSIDHNIAKDDFAALTADGVNPMLRVTMIVRGH